MTDDFEQQLRHRLQAMPEPTLHLDPEAVARDAHRRRRPKVIAVAATAVAACALVVTPVALSAVSLSGTATSSDTAGAPAAPSEDGEPEDASGVPATCSAVALREQYPSVDTVFAAPPGNLTASVAVTNRGTTEIVVGASPIGVAHLDSSGAVVAVTILEADAVASQSVAPGESIVFDDVSLDQRTTECSAGAASSAIAVAPLILVLQGDDWVPMIGSAL